MEAILHGVILAFGLILPLGVQNVFIFSQGATQPNLARALPATITAAICDSILILLAVYGLSLVILQYEGLRVMLMVAGDIIFALYELFDMAGYPDRGKWSKCFADEEANSVRLNGIAIKSACNFRYCRSDWYKRVKI